MKRYVCQSTNEAWVGIAPTYKGFADPCLATWLPSHFCRLAKRDNNPAKLGRLNYILF